MSGKKTAARGARPYRKAAGKAAEILVFVVFAFVNLLPIFWGMVTSLKQNRELFAYPPKVLGFHAVWDSYKLVLDGGIFHSLLISVFYALGSIVIGLLLGMMCAYAIKRCRFRGKKAVFYLVVAGIPLSIGSAALLIPNYLYMSRLGLVDKWFTLPVMYAAYNIPMAIWIMIGGLESIPVEIEEAASVDGCSRGYIVFRLIPLLNRPAMASAALFVFIGAWNEFNVASVMVNSPALRPVQLSIYYYMGFFGLDWGALTAATTIAVVPTLVIFCFLGQFMVSGLTQGSVKG